MGLFETKGRPLEPEEIKNYDLTLNDEQKKSLVSQKNNRQPTQEVQEKAKQRKLEIFGQMGKDFTSTNQANQTNQTQEDNAQDFSAQNKSAQHYAPTGVQYFDDKLAQGKGFSFIEAYLAKNMLGIDLRAHINANVNMKQDQKMRNMTSLYQELYKQTKAIDSIDRALSSDLYHASGFGGAIKKGMRNVAGTQWDNDTEQAWNNLDQAVVDTANATKISGITGKDHVNRIEERFYKSLTDNTTRGRALLDTREQLENNMINLYRTIAQMGGDPQMVAEMDKWYAQSQENKRKIQNNFNKKESKRHDPELYNQIINQKNPFVAFAQNSQAQNTQNEVSLENGDE